MVRSVVNLKVEYRVIDGLKPKARNPHTHSRAQIRRIADSIRRFGWTMPVLVDGEDRIVAGHGRIEAARYLNITEVPTLRLERLSEAELRAYALADNKLAELAGWDPELLVIELQELAALDLDFNVEITGFDAPEIEALIAKRDTSVDIGTDGADDPILPDGPAVSRSGDIWKLGSHRLCCGDALDVTSYRVLLDRERARAVITDPPYNVPIVGHVSGLGKTKHREFEMASGEMAEAEFAAFLEAAFRNMAAFSIDGSLHYIFMDWRHLYELLSAGRQVYSKLMNLAVWTKTNAGMGSLYRSQHELVAIFKNGNRKHVNNVMLGRHGRYRTNVWSYPGANAFGQDRAETLAVHPTVKPVTLVADALLDCTRRGDCVLDPFGGAGTTIIAAEKTGRRAYVVEIDPVYVDSALRRWQTLTGLEPVDTRTGRTFSDLKDERNAAGGQVLAAKRARKK